MKLKIVVNPNSNNLNTVWLCVIDRDTGKPFCDAELIYTHELVAKRNKLIDRLCSMPEVNSVIAKEINQ